MATKKRKIGFYYLTLTLNENDIEIQDALNQVLIHINNLNKVDRKKTLTGKKFGLLDNINSNRERTKHKLLFKSATHSFRPPLIDKTTANERVSPKTINEGEIHKTHITTKTINGDIIIVLEKHLNAMTINQIIDYLNYYALQLEDENQFTFSSEIIVKDDFLEEIDDLSRVVCADVYVDKQVLGGDALNFSERINTVQHEVIVSVKAKRSDSIRDFTRDIYAVFNGGKQSVNKIRLIGRNNDNNIVTINTDLIERQEYVMTMINDVTGEIVSSELFIEIDSILRNYN